MWDALSGLKTHAIRPHSQWLMTCAFSPAGEMVATGGLDNRCSVYQLSAEPEADGNLPLAQSLVTILVKSLDNGIKHWHSAIGIP